MSNLEQYYKYSLLSQAAYADELQAGMYDSVIYRDKLTSTTLNRNPFTNTQAEIFTSKYEVLAHQPNTDEGFSTEIGVRDQLFLI